MADVGEASQTSALDSTTEADLMRNINSTLLSKQRTSVFIAHRYVFPSLRASAADLRAQAEDDRGC